MPIYEYECLTCGNQFEVRQSFNDEPRAVCPNGHKKTRRLLAAPAIVFKGNGFYITDNRNAGKNGANGTSKTSKPETKSETKSEQKSKSSKEVA